MEIYIYNQKWWKLRRANKNELKIKTYIYVSIGLFDLLKPRIIYVLFGNIWCVYKWSKGDQNIYIELQPIKCGQAIFFFLGYQIKAACTHKNFIVKTSKMATMNNPT